MASIIIDLPIRVEFLFIFFGLRFLKLYLTGELLNT